MIVKIIDPWNWQYRMQGTVVSQDGPIWRVETEYGIARYNASQLAVINVRNRSLQLEYGDSSNAAVQEMFEEPPAAVLHTARPHLHNLS
jgi:hypothetical protein